MGFCNFILFQLKKTTSQSSNSGNEQSTLSESGWKRFSDGLTIEWGAASGTGKHVFPRAFSKVFSVTITKNNDNSGRAPGVDTIITGTDNTGFYTRIQKMWDTQYNGASLSNDWHSVYYSSLQLLSRLLIAPSQCLQSLEQCA